MSRYDTIDISPLFGNDMDAKMAVAKRIDRTCRNTSFFWIKNHGIDCLSELYKQAKNLHLKMTTEEKYQLAIKAYNKDSNYDLTGYYMAIPGKKTVESFYIQNPSFNADHRLIKSKTPLHEVSRWPDEEKYPGFKEFMIEYYWKMFEMTKVLLRGFALALGKDENFFDCVYKKEDTISSVRVISSPYIKEDPSIITAADGLKLCFEAHTDVSLISLAFQPYVSNIQVETPEGFVDIEYSDENILVHCGRFMEMMTNGYYKAPVHRLKYVKQDRLTLPYFVHFAFDSEIEAFSPHETSQPEISKNKKLNYGDFFTEERVKLIKTNGQT